MQLIPITFACWSQKKKEELLHLSYYICTSWPSNLKSLKCFVKEFMSPPQPGPSSFGPIICHSSPSAIIYHSLPRAIIYCHSSARPIICHSSPKAIICYQSSATRGQQRRSASWRWRSSPKKSWISYHICNHYFFLLSLCRWLCSILWLILCAFKSYLECLHRHNILEGVCNNIKATKKICTCKAKIRYVSKCLISSSSSSLLIGLDISGSGFQFPFEDSVFSEWTEFVWQILLLLGGNIHEYCFILYHFVAYSLLSFYSWFSALILKLILCSLCLCVSYSILSNKTPIAWISMPEVSW